MYMFMYVYMQNICNDKCFIYPLNCVRHAVNKYRYNLDHFRSRWDNNDHKIDFKKDDSGNMEYIMENFLQSHFLQTDH